MKARRKIQQKLQMWLQYEYQSVNIGNNVSTSEKNYITMT